MTNSQHYNYLRNTADGFVTVGDSRLLAVVLFGGSNATSAVFYDVGTAVLDVNVPANDTRVIDMSCLGGIASHGIWLDITGTNAVALTAVDGSLAVATNISVATTLVVGDNRKGYTITANGNTHRLPAAATLSRDYTVAFWNKSASDNTILVPVAALGAGLVLNNAEGPADGVILNQNEAVSFFYDGARWIATGNGAATTV